MGSFGGNYLGIPILTKGWTFFKNTNFVETHPKKKQEKIQKY